VARRGIVCGGAFCVDRNKTINFWPPPEESLSIILSEENQGGASGTNASVDLKKLGAPFPIEAIGIVGDDADGRFLLELCERMGIIATQLKVVSGVATAYTDVITALSSGKRTFFYWPGTHAIVSPDHFNFARTSGKILHLGLLGTMATMDSPWHDDPSGWVAVLKRARAEGLKTNIEMCPVPPEVNARLGRPCLPHLDYVIVNDAEAGALADIQTIKDGKADVARCRDAAAAIVAAGPELAVVHFPAGAVAASRDGARASKPSVRVPREEIKGNNGAGDAFASGMLLGIHEGWPLEECLTLANASAAASLRAFTTNGAVVPWRECLALAEKWGWRDMPT
jgi:sugar/nucleoside kinase (ribokinase family)